jgi:hypothetical protein
MGDFTTLMANVIVSDYRYFLTVNYDIILAQLVDMELASCFAKDWVMIPT